jgi:hypothetical protein
MVTVPHRADHEQPDVVAKLGWRYHHIGIPTTAKRADEKYIEQFKMYVSGFCTSPYGVEWMRFERDSPLPEVIRTVAHVAFEVEDIDKALIGQEVIFPPGVPSEGVRSAMIMYDHAPVELIAFGKSCRSGG